MLAWRGRMAGRALQLGAAVVAAATNLAASRLCHLVPLAVHLTLQDLQKLERRAIREEQAQRAAFAAVQAQAMTAVSGAKPTIMRGQVRRMPVHGQLLGMPVPCWAPAVAAHQHHLGWCGATCRDRAAPRTSI
jgi:hypothetical protein